MSARPSVSSLQQGRLMFSYEKSHLIGTANRPAPHIHRLMLCEAGISSKRSEENLASLV